MQRSSLRCSSAPVATFSPIVPAPVRVGNFAFLSMGSQLRSWIRRG
uniref:Uncharacterized protein n=1 Tax=Arundo donax TaxID=35708 RepID=A0A0A9G280_ARUDO